MNDDEQPEDIYEDEDDENSENNWRNEYPEEESSDEDSRGGWQPWVGRDWEDPNLTYT